jgi:cytochrome c5
MNAPSVSALVPSPGSARYRVSLLAVLGWALTGCSHPAQVDRASLVARAEAMAPQDARVADLYQHACRACHVVATSGAPITGDRDAWHDRWKKGLPKLVENAVTGLNGMPAGGQCVRCTLADYEALIRFMAAETP